MRRIMRRDMGSTRILGVCNAARVSSCRRRISGSDQCRLELPSSLPHATAKSPRARGIHPSIKIQPEDAPDGSRVLTVNNSCTALHMFYPFAALQAGAAHNWPSVCYGGSTVEALLKAFRH